MDPMMTIGWMMIGCEYRNHDKLWLTITHIESIAGAKNGSTIRMVSGMIHDVLDTPEEIIQRIETVTSRF